VIVHERIEGSQLAGNLLDDPAERDGDDLHRE